MDMKDLTPDELQASRPDLVEAITARAQEAAKEQAAKDIEAAEEAAVAEHTRAQEAKAAEEQEAADKLAADAEKSDLTRVQESTDAKFAEQAKELAGFKEREAKRDTAEVVAVQVQEAEGLTEASKAQIVAQFAGQSIPAADIPTRVQEACESARGYEMALLKESGAGTKVQGAGPTAVTVTKEVQEARSADLEDRLRADGKSEAEIEKLMAAR